jgi:hypothetical protein
MGQPNANCGPTSELPIANSLNGPYLESGLQVMWEDGERIFCREWGRSDDDSPRSVLTVRPSADHPSRSSLDRLTHEYELSDELDVAWAARPLELVHNGGRTLLVLEDAGGEPLERLIGAPMETGRFLHLAIASSPRCARRTSAALCTRTSSRPTSS